MKRAFSLLELMVVVAILAVLAGLLFPALANAKDRARLAPDIAALAQLGHAYALYESDYGRYPQRLKQLDLRAFPAESLYSLRDPFPEGEASALTHDASRRTSYIDPCGYGSMDYDPLTHSARKVCEATPEELLELSASGPLVFLSDPSGLSRISPGVRFAPARYLRLTFAGGVLNRTSRSYRSKGGARTVESDWSDAPVARFYDESGDPETTFRKIRGIP